MTNVRAEEWALRLYVAGMTPTARTALANIEKICAQYLETYSIVVIDLLEKPALAEGDGIVAVPTLVRMLPRPPRKLIGDLSDTQKVVVGLEMTPFGRRREKDPCRRKRP